MVHLVRISGIITLCAGVQASLLDPRQDIQTAATTTTDGTPTITSLADLPDISAPAQIGLIMPNPDNPVYVGVIYTFGFVDPTPGPPEAQDGVLRQVTPLINFPNYTTSVFPPYSSLSTDPADHVNDTQLEDTPGAGWCSVDLAPRVRTFDFEFVMTGWHMFVVNTTWARPTINGADPSQNCTLPYLGLYSFFATQTLKVLAVPEGQSPTAPTPAFTLLKDLDWRTPGELPLEKKESTSQKKTIAVLAALGAFALVGAMATFIWLERRKKKAEIEAIAISRLPPEERAAFLTPQDYTNADPRNVFPAEMRYAGVARDPVHPSHLIPVGQVRRQEFGYDPRTGSGGGVPMGSVGWRGAWDRAMGRGGY
ncbi:hypothetical protein HD553DRAFT_346953 [Filobasidium floriforme]|uniref:uncharacterized protein n=1 Tax=Filobasidium floriforme TaxID=5210 RepID=UPI001E8D896A|nr:uncharacterized protein HD553DRAFT_346953 [Filobasidium floriforme]KAH8090460.1 hypothetical protein HD553DRAFT_346953 [Filobasidium floriforme]